MKTWKVGLIIWGPILAILVIYGAVYLINYEHAKRTFNKYQTAYSNCNNANQNATAPAGEVPQIFNCSAPGTMSHGFLWLPRYQQ